MRHRKFRSRLPPRGSPTPLPGNTVLHYAAGNGDVPLATYLLTAHANMSLRNHRKEAPIDVRSLRALVQSQVI